MGQVTRDCKGSMASLEAVQERLGASFLLNFSSTSPEPLEAVEDRQEGSSSLILSRNLHETQCLHTAQCVVWLTSYPYHPVLESWDACSGCFLWIVSNKTDTETDTVPAQVTPGPLESLLVELQVEGLVDSWPTRGGGLGRIGRKFYERNRRSVKEGTQGDSPQICTEGH